MKKGDANAFEPEGLTFNSRGLSEALGAKPPVSFDKNTTLKGSSLHSERTMAQTLTKLFVHIVFSTRLRQPLITPEIEPELYAYIGGVCKSNGSVLTAAGGATDHIHLLVSMSKSITVSDLLLEIKRDSSSWIKRGRPSFAGFHWQDGYGAFTIGESQVGALRKYFAGQKEHHKRVSFQDEFRDLLRKYKVEFDERYVWS